MNEKQDIEVLVRILVEENALLKEETVRMRERIAYLESRLSYCEHSKDSSNSSIPPSQDPHRPKRTMSLRESNGKKPGGQLGHKGHSLEFSSEPDEVIIHQPDYCSVCGKDLSGIEVVLEGRRQVIDIPPTVPQIIERRIYSRKCSCGHRQVSAYPQEAHSPVCYGENLLGLTGYLHSRQYIPFDRMREMFRDVFGLEISSGSLVEMVQRLAKKAGSMYEIIRQRIASSPYVGADETGVCIKGRNQWAWTFQTENATFITIDASRGKKVIERNFKEGFPHSTLGHDCWKPYFNTPAQAHQICTAHLLRELKYLGQLYNDGWAKDFTLLLTDTQQLKRELLPVDYLQPIEKRKQLELRLDELLQQAINPKYEKLITFKNRMTKYRQYLFRFLYQQDVPPDNNASERAVRTFKVKQKVSGFFRSSNGRRLLPLFVLSLIPLSKTRKMFGAH
jgi:transposase